MPADWQLRPPEFTRSARRALGPGYQRLIALGEILLTPEGGWMLGPPASTGETWSTIMYLVATASDRLARYSHATHSSTPGPATIQELAERARAEIERLGAAIIHALADRIDQATLLKEASAFVDEIADEDNGIIHTSDALGSLLTPSSCAEDQHPLPDSEQANAAIRILAPLLAQYARLHDV